ncbi:MAG: YicC family protein [Desulfovibrio sp.]|jgi:uncharacterized protein (TIGR00255 family)|nr:YicC family protein [Desulfovibrio sp.]
MLRSMTGFGRCFLEDTRQTQVWEVRSVNGRHLDIRFKLPSRVRAFEPVLEKSVKAQALRGRLDISLFLQIKQDGAHGLYFNEELADAMLLSLSEYAGARGDVFNADYSRLLNIPLLWEENTVDADDEVMQGLLQGLEEALEDWNESRAVEGKALEKDLRSRILHMEEWLRNIRDRAPFIKEERAAQLHERLSEALDRQGLDLDEGRFLQEVTLLADKVDVSEELTRLAAHLERLRELMSLDKDAGRKLDFTLQECFREVTTCGNKIQDVQVSRLVVDLKNELEKCREQVQNVE